MSIPFIIEMCIRDRQETSDYLRKAMQAVVSNEGTGSKGIIQGYAIGGKTGTAEPVSYTHLDVYKRQGFTLIEVLVAFVLLTVFSTMVGGALMAINSSNNTYADVGAGQSSSYSNAESLSLIHI